MRKHARALAAEVAVTLLYWCLGSAYQLMYHSISGELSLPERRRSQRQVLTPML